MGEDQDPGGTMDPEPGDVKTSRNRKTSLDIYDVTTLARQSYEEEKISPLRQLRQMNESFVKRQQKSATLTNRRSADSDNRRRSPNYHSARYIELSENVRNMARRNSFDVINTTESRDNTNGCPGLKPKVNSLEISLPITDPVIDKFVPSDSVSMDQDSSYHSDLTIPQDEMSSDHLEDNTVELDITPARKIPGVLQIPDFNGRLKSEEPPEDDRVIYDMTSPKPVIDVKLSKDPTSPKYAPVKRPVVHVSKSSDDFLSSRQERHSGNYREPQRYPVESPHRWSRSDTGSEAYSSRSERSYAGSDPYSSRSEKSYSGSEPRSNVSEKYDHGYDKYSAKSSSATSSQKYGPAPVIDWSASHNNNQPIQPRRSSNPVSNDDFFSSTMAAMGNIMQKYDSPDDKDEDDLAIVPPYPEELPLPDYPDDNYEISSDCGDTLPPPMPEMLQTPPRSPMPEEPQEIIPSPTSPVSPTYSNRNSMLTAGDLARVELFYKSRGSHVIVCHCLAEFYEQNELGQWLYRNRGIPVLILTTGAKKGQKRELRIVLAESGTGFRLWEDTINHLSNYTDESPKVHTMQQSRDHTKRVSFRMHSVAASTEFLGKFKELTSDPDDELWKVGKSKKSKKTKGFFTSRKGKKKLGKKDISTPCNFMHVTKVEPIIDQSPPREPLEDEFRQRCNTSDW